MNILNKVLSYSTAILLTAGCLSADFFSKDNYKTIFADDTSGIVAVTVNNFNYNLDYKNNTCTLTNIVYSEKNIDIPEYLEISGNKFYVSYIEQEFFLKLNGVESINFPKTIAQLPEDIFGKIPSISKVTMDSDNEDYCIEDNILYSRSKAELLGCFNKEITSVTIPDTVVRINEYAFSDCTLLQNVSIPPSVSNYGSYAFRNCTSLKSITFEKGETATVFPGDPTFFENCSFYFKGYTGESEDKLTQFTNYYEDKCTYKDDTKTTLTRYLGKDSSFTVPDTVKTIGVTAFGNNETLTEITLPSSLERINGSAFTRCYGLTKIEIPDSVKYIENSAFSECCNLKEVKLSENISTIPTFCFYNCINLETIYIPESVDEIQSYAFYLAGNIKKIIYGGTEDQWEDIVVFFLASSEFLLDEDEIEMVFEGDKPVLPGDIDGDGVVNAEDFNRLTNCLLESVVLNNNQKENADINGDGIISISDLADLKILLVNSGNISGVRIDEPYK